MGREMLYTAATQSVPAPLLGTPPVPPHSVTDFLEEGVWPGWVVDSSASGRSALLEAEISAVAALCHVDVLHFTSRIIVDPELRISW